MARSRYDDQVLQKPGDLNHWREFRLILAFQWCKGNASIASPAQRSGPSTVEGVDRKKVGLSRYPKLSHTLQLLSLMQNLMLLSSRFGFVWWWDVEISWSHDNRHHVWVDSFRTWLI